MQVCYQCLGKGSTLSGGQPSHDKEGNKKNNGHGGQSAQNVSGCPTCKGTGIQNSFGV